MVHIVSLGRQPATHEVLFLLVLATLEAGLALGGLSVLLVAPGPRAFASGGAPGLRQLWVLKAAGVHADWGCGLACVASWCWSPDLIKAVIVLDQVGGSHLVVRSLLLQAGEVNFA